MMQHLSLNLEIDLNLLVN